MTSKPKVLLFNPRAANHKPRIPNSVLQVASSINHFCDWVIVDGNLEDEIFTTLFFFD
jgi:anaerobic magnesium-protoporphyrin IX monomethyl ester cyclase